MSITVLHRITINRLLNRGEVLDLNSHFDLLPIGKYHDYCKVSSFQCTVDSDKPVKIQILLYSKDCKLTIVESKEFQSGNNVLAGFRLTAFETCKVNCIKVSCNKIPKIINLALCICTYHMEKAIIEKINKCQGLAEIYITDNGQTLGNINGAHVFQSPNYGGSLGFTNSLIEASKNQNITHFILNDDDADFDPEVLFRTKAFLSVCDKDICICGSMIDADDKHTIVESGSRFEKTEIHPFDKGRNIQVLTDNIQLERSKEIHYGGWWYFTLSRATFYETGLPLPLFIKMDDVEYGCRIKKEKISLIGISVYHRNFAVKYSPVNYYYYIRNLLITGYTSKRITAKDLNEIISKIYLEIACYRYSNAEMMIIAIEDYLKGPSYVFSLYKYGMIKPITPISLSPLPEYIEIPGIKPAGFLFRKVTLNGAVLPSKGSKIEKITNMQTKDFYRLKEVLYNVDNKVGFIERKNTIRTIKLTIRCAALSRSLKRKFLVLSEKYAKESKIFLNPHYRH